jgi:phage tail-like protein
MSTTLYPQVAFSYSVTIDGNTISFSEVSGLVFETTPIEYRAGDAIPYSVQKMPGLQKYGAVTMKKGMFKGDIDLYNWFNTILMNTVTRKAVTISLLDETHSPVCKWTLTAAWPSKFDGGPYKSTDANVVIESLQIEHEGMNYSLA